MEQEQEIERLERKLEERKAHLERVTAQSERMVNTHKHPHTYPYTSLCTSVFCTVLSHKITHYSCVLQELEVQEALAQEPEEAIQLKMITDTIAGILDRAGGPGSSSRVTDPIEQLEVVNNAKILLAFLNEYVFVVDMI